MIFIGIIWHGVTPFLHEYWPRLIRYIARGDRPIDNNPAENAIYSLIETAKANGLEPCTWLCHALQHLPCATKLENYEALMPWYFRHVHLTAP